MVDPRKVRHLLALFLRYRGYLDDLARRGDEQLRADFAVIGGKVVQLSMAIAGFRDASAPTCASSA